MARHLGTPLMPWQQHVADVALEVEPTTGRLAYRRVILTVPRQSGKTTLLLALFVWRALVMGSPQGMAFTAQNGLAARMRLQREWHELLRRVPAFRDTYRTSWKTGAEALLFHNGSFLQAVAGTEDAGHGLTLDLAVIDEAFAQPNGRLEQAFGPTMLTRPQPQLWFVSTAGAPSDRWFREKVEAGRAAEAGSGVAFFEWSAPDDADITDREAWRACMPALGYTVSEATIVAEMMALRDRPDEFRRAYLNQWVAPKHDAEALPGWDLLATSSTKMVDPVFGVDVDGDRQAVAVAAWRASGLQFVEMGEPVPAHELGAKLRAVAGDRPVACPPSLKPDLDRAGVRVVELKSAQWPQACAGLIDAVKGQTLRHPGQPAFDEAVRALAEPKYSASGAPYFVLQNSPGAGPAFAAARALWALDQTPASVYEDRGMLVL